MNSIMPKFEHKAGTTNYTSW